MRVLLDENLPHGLAGLLSGHEVRTVADLGWAGILNGELLQRAADRFDALRTMDRRLPMQQDVTRLAFAIVLIQAPSNRMVHLRPLVPAILRALSELKAGTVATVGA